MSDLLCWCLSDLRYDSQSLSQAVQADFSDILPCDVDVTPLGLIEAEEQPHNGALPADRREEKTNTFYCVVCKIQTVTTPHGLLRMLSFLKSEDNRDAPINQPEP